METRSGRFGRTRRPPHTRRSVREDILALRHELERLDEVLGSAPAPQGARAALDYAFTHLRAAEHAWQAGWRPADLPLVLIQIDAARNALDAAVAVRAGKLGRVRVPASPKIALVPEDPGHMHQTMQHGFVEGSCRESAREGLLGVVDALKADLDRAAEATGTDHAPIAARADYLRARDAYRRAVVAWSQTSGDDRLDPVTGALEQCRAALARLRR
jgi:hypothetical protein